MPTKHPTSMRLSPETSELIASLAERLGVTRAAVIDMATRVMREVLDSLRVRPIYESEEAFMRALGMQEDDIAWVLAQPREPAPDEEYVQVEGLPGAPRSVHGNV